MEESRIVKALLEGMILKHEATRWANASTNKKTASTKKLSSVIFDFRPADLLEAMLLTGK